MSGPADAANEAIAKALAELGADAGGYQLIGANSRATAKEADPFVWHVEFKSAASMPKKRGGKAGKGGGLVVSVDLETGAVERLRGGD